MHREGERKNRENMEKEDRILLAGIEDRIRQTEERYMMTNSRFLDLRQRSLAEVLSRSRCGGITYGFYGGYEDAERVVEVFFPSELMEADSPEEHFRRIPEDNPLTVIRAELKKGTPSLSHRDYLGALMGLGIKREMTGDIIVRDDGADIIVLREAAEFLLLHYTKAGRANLLLSEAAIDELRTAEGSAEEIAASVASLRLDNVVAAAFHVQRSRAAEAVEAGSVYVNGICEKKPDRQVKEGDKIVFRGKGRARLLSAGGQNSKGRRKITLRRNI